MDDHDIRTKIAIIHGAINLIVQYYEDDPEKNAEAIKKHSDAIHRSSAELKDMLTK